MISVTECSCTSSPESKQTKYGGIHMEARQRERQDKVKHICTYRNNYTMVNHKMFQNILVDDKRKLLFCIIHKVASTTTKKTIIHSSGRANETIVRQMDINNVTILQQHGLWLLSKYSIENIFDKIKNYYKVMFVRCPLRRLLSAFRDRFEIKKYREAFRRLHGRAAIKQFRKNATKEALHKANDVQFDEFLQYITNQARRHQTLNTHWNTYQKNCRPCLVEYDFIGKLETYESDMKYLLSKIANTTVKPIQQQYGPSSYNTNKDTNAAYNEYYGKIPSGIMQDVREVFGIDFDLYGYDFDKTTVKGNRAPIGQKPTVNDREPGQKPAVNDKREPGHKAIVKDYREPGQKPAVNDNREPGQKPTVNDKRKPGLKPAMKVNRKPGQKPAVKDKREPGQKPAVKDNRKPGQKPAVNDKENQDRNQL